MTRTIFLFALACACTFGASTSTGHGSTVALKSGSAEAPLSAPVTVTNQAVKLAGGSGGGDGSHNGGDGNDCNCNCDRSLLVSLYVFENTNTGSRLLTLNPSDPALMGKQLSIFNNLCPHYPSSFSIFSRLILFSVGGPYTTPGSVIARVFGSPVPGTVPLYRMYNTGSEDHFYTTSVDEVTSAINTYGYTLVGVEFYIDTQARCPGEAPLFRFRQGALHIFTLDWTEYDPATTVYEGITGFVFPVPT